ncbi:hypothetical protein ACTXT7_005522 [Hymenolepis weldensis]
MEENPSVRLQEMIREHSRILPLNSNFLFLLHAAEVGISLNTVPSSSIDVNNANRLDIRKVVVAYRPPPELSNCPPTT